ncbi:hypothetical protein AQJ11_11920 [Streptomyces corchorusii]|uniref:Uncharacterized protein n=2 Tax=Streptomyces TaxID=1883 RepID=A0A117QIN4_STRCK|nr:hypothetical protein [Streptomyces corchorusii]KUN30462.1 hypothetical protein AQJ11_11920 [Streptomyces corchorusii]
MPTVGPVSMRDLLAACAAADAVSRPPRPEHPDGARGPAEQMADAAWARPAETAPQPSGRASRHGA